MRHDSRPGCRGPFHWNLKSEDRCRLATRMGISLPCVAIYGILFATCGYGKLFVTCGYDILFATVAMASFLPRVATTSSLPHVAEVSSLPLVAINRGGSHCTRRQRQKPLHCRKAGAVNLCLQGKKVKPLWVKTGGGKFFSPLTLSTDPDEYVTTVTLPPPSRKSLQKHRIKPCCE